MWRADMNETIEGMAKLIKPIIVSSYLVDRNGEVKRKTIEDVKKQQIRNATALYNAGYRKECDTAKEILQRGKYCMPSGLREWICERYGIEVE